MNNTNILYGLVYLFRTKVTSIVKNTDINSITSLVNIRQKSSGWVHVKGAAESSCGFWDKAGFPD